MNRIRLLASMAAWVALAVSALAAGTLSAQPAKSGSPVAPMASAADAKNIAADAYIQTYPLLQAARELDRQMNKPDAFDYVGKLNVLKHQDAMPSPKDPTIRRMSYDAPYSRAWLDLRAEPVVVQLPAVPAGRFVVAQIFDLWGQNVAYADAKSAAGKAVNLLIAGPNWKRAQPKGIDRVVRVDTSLAGLVIRTAAAAPGNAASVVALQQQYRIAPLSQFAKAASPKPALPATFPAWDDARADSGAFIGYVNALLPFVQLDAAEQIAFKRYATIGMNPGKPWEPAMADAAVVAAIDGGVTEGRGKLEKAMAEARGAVDPVGTREAYGGDAMKRAVSAGFDLHRIGRALILEVPITGDGGGDPFEKGAKYRLIFPAGQLPPVDGFWSLEMIGVPNVVYVENPIHRYVIDSRMPELRKNPDGALEIAIQRDSPGPELESNWLPSPDSGFSLTLRLYAPKQAAVDGTWKSAWPNRMP